MTPFNICMSLQSTVNGIMTRRTFSAVYAYSGATCYRSATMRSCTARARCSARCPADNWQKYAGVRALFAYQWAHPGKKLTFMGNELAQWGEWDHDNSIDWDCLNWQEHASVQRLVADLNKLYKQTPAIWSQDFTPTASSGSPATTPTTTR